ncbi:hypothetical protein ACWD7F_38155 [Streptomyces sp. NPDC005122]
MKEGTGVTRPSADEQDTQRHGGREPEEAPRGTETDEYHEYLGADHQIWVASKDGSMNMHLSDAVRWIPGYANYRGHVTAVIPETPGLASPYN